MTGAGTILDVRTEVARGSTRRMLMLLCLLLVSCSYMFYVTALTLHASSFEECLAEAGVSLDALPPEVTSVGSEAFDACRADAANGAGSVAVTGTAAVLVIAAVVYWWLPSWRWRRGRLVPIERVAEPASAGAESLPAHVSRLAAEVGVSPMPVFAVDPRALTAGAVAFGRAGRYTVCLHAGLVARRATSPETFDAVLLHELAHVQSRDVDVAYLTVALWRVVSVAVLVPFVLVQSWLLARDLLAGAERVDWVEATPSLGKLAFGAFLVAQVYLARNELLRSRELCADLDAMAAGAHPRVWDPRLRGVPVNTEGDVAPPPGWFASLWHSHPAWHRRYAVLVGDYSINAGASGLQAMLAFGAMFGVVGTIYGMPAWLMVTMVYLVGPIVVATLVVSTPPKRPGSIRISRPAADHRRRRVVRPLVPLTALMAVLAALVIYDPLGGFRDDPGNFPAPTMPHPYEVRRPIANLPDGAAIATWLHHGGRDAIIGLHRSFDVDVERLIHAPPDSPELADHCARAADAIAAGRELTPSPDPIVEQAWGVMLTAAESGSERVCTRTAPGEPTQLRGGQAELHYESVQAVYRTLVVLLDPYAEDAFPPGREGPAPAAPGT